jgi:hypothetical protein
MKFFMLATFFAFHSTLSIADVFSFNGAKHGDTFVKVTTMGEDVRFEKCVTGYEEANCQQLGPRSSYSKRELKSQRSIEHMQLATVVVGGGLSIAFVAGLGPVGALLIAGAASIPAMGAGSLDDLSRKFGRVNIVSQYRQVQAITYAVVDDKDVKVKDVENFIFHLDATLYKLRKRGLEVRSL